MNPAAPVYACVEGGGTKFVVGVARSPEAVLETARFPTTTPGETLGAVISWLVDAAARHGPLAAAGIGSFGPIELDPGSPQWGHVLNTPKPAWQGADVCGPLSAALKVPVGLDTDVNAAAIAEHRWGAAQAQRVAAYITVGPGIGGGMIVGGAPVQGLTHPEIGHFPVRRHPRDSFPGVCAVHGDCIEGLAAGPAIIARWGASLSDLPPDHPGPELVAWYLGQLAVTLQAALEPGRIVFGGGVLNTPGLLEGIRRNAAAIGAGYFRGRADQVIVPPGLGGRAGLLGALALAMAAAGR